MRVLNQHGENLHSRVDQLPADLTEMSLLREHCSENVDGNATHCFMEQPVSHLTHEAHQKCQNVDMALSLSLLDTSDPCHSIPDSRQCMKRFLCFRLTSHSLPDETGKHRRPHIPGSFRLCPHCPLSSVGDEQHFVFECRFCGPFRDKFHLSTAEHLQRYIYQPSRIL